MVTLDINGMPYLRQQLCRCLPELLARQVHRHSSMPVFASSLLPRAATLTGGEWSPSRRTRAPKERVVHSCGRASTCQRLFEEASSYYCLKKQVLYLALTHPPLDPTSTLPQIAWYAPSRGRAGASGGATQRRSKCRALAGSV